MDKLYSGTRFSSILIADENDSRLYILAIGAPLRLEPDISAVFRWRLIFISLGIAEAPDFKPGSGYKKLEFKLGKEFIKELIEGVTPRREICVQWRQVDSPGSLT